MGRIIDDAYKMRLKEIDLLREFCIILVVLDHSFAFYSGHWNNIYELPDIKAYFWIGRFASSFMLPLFVFISGYVFSWQIFVKKKEYSISSLLMSKTKRLLIPCYIFGILFILLFDNIANWLNISGLIKFLSGVEHLWFLPMLFWCFPIGYFLIKSRLNSWLILLVLAVFNVIVVKTTSIGILHGFSYLLYFYFGHVAYNKKTYLEAIPIIRLCLMVGAFLICFYFLTPEIASVEMLKPDSFVDKVKTQWFSHVLNFPISLLGVLTTYCFVLLIEKTRWFYSEKLVKTSMGIYIFHYFIIWFLLTYFNVYQYVNGYILPFILFFFSYFGAFVLTSLLLKTKIGKFFL